MRVHHIINDICLDRGGAQRIVRFLHQGLSEHDIDSYIVALNGTTGNLSNVISIDCPSPYSWQAFWFVYQYLQKQCLPEDIVHGHLFPTILYIALAAKMLRWPGRLVCTEHNTHNRRRGTIIGKLVDSQIYPAYEQIYCISSGTKNALRGWMPDQADKLRVIENGTSLPCSQFKPRTPKNKIIIVSVGRLNKQKNYTAAIQAMSLLRNVSVEYRIAGLGPEETALKSLCVQLGLTDIVKFYGYVDDIFAFFKQADVFLMPSRWEGFGLAAVEAMNTGLPVIASSVDGLREIVDTPAPCGILVSPDNPKEIAAAVKTLLDLKTRLIYGKNAFNRSVEFSIEKMINRYLNAYNV
ncbi:glycosyltransferase family 4 protein [Nodosilinea sp. P-1105]|uniref:glycosyltransferase family 4 protein n=1 Tax=Nodosilinea sp. P-1105 TaxID=2546229 RepID=UPI00146A6FF2|nr:glycosyltransferase family 4 protein [Nodosilinea sp. P-1105]NMF82638.1 glycosyltransferase [Nodosilinea sp. P-1105]